MGPVEQGLRIRAQEIHSRLRNTQPPGLMIRNQQLQAQVDNLREQLDAAKAEIERLSPKIFQHPVHRIIELVSVNEHISKTEIVSQRRDKHACHARHIACYLAATTTTYSLPQIGCQFGGRDHTTVLHGRDKIKKMRASNPAFDLRLRWYEEQIGADRKGA
mgnify:FL=1